MTQYSRPDSDPSQTTNWAPSTGSDLFAMIDEASPNDADYVSVQDQMSGATSRVIEHAPTRQYAQRKDGRSGFLSNM